MAGEVIEGFTAEEEAYFYEVSKEKYELDMQEYETQAWRKGIAEGREAGLAKGMEQGLSKGLEQGRAKGMEQGRAKKEREVFRQDLETAKKMRGRGFSLEEISEWLPRLTMEEILEAIR